MSKMSKACDISPKVRQRICQRDGGKCIICGKPGIPNSHYIKRSHGGLGVERNTGTMCTTCHNEYDNGSGKYSIAIKQAFKDYLSPCYADWNEESLYYDKYRWLKHED